MTDRFHPITHPIRRPVPGGKADDNPDVAFVQRADVNPDAGGIHGAFQHVAIFKNILVAADGDKSARLRVFDVRDWSEKQVIRVGAVSEAPATIRRRGTGTRGGHVPRVRRHDNRVRHRRGTRAHLAISRARG